MISYFYNQIHLSTESREFEKKGYHHDILYAEKVEGTIGKEWTLENGSQTTRQGGTKS